ncbi:MAG: DNA-protecting protein DprA [Clostridiales bacterium]|nr:DNA-protecting protein DprA [Clostridiales bacterium]
MGIVREELYKYWIASIPNIRANKIEAMLEFFGNPEDVFLASTKSMYDMKKFCEKKKIRMTNKNIDFIIASKDMDKINKEYTYLREHGINFVTKLDDSYPEKLRHIFDAPFSLYTKGKPFPNHRKAISIVGARECTIYGRETAKYLAAAIAREGIVVISGLARGIDSYAHTGAVSVGGSTYGIMGCGIDICYPRENINLYMEIQDRGGLISEYGPGEKPLAYHFPMRNRIISGLSDGILVIEAKEKSGSLITVDMGLDQGKNIYAVPGRISDKLSCGCNNLIKIGAKMVTTPEDIIEDLLGYSSRKEDGQLNFNGLLNADEQIIYENLTLSPKHMDDLLTITGFEFGQLMENLLSLELKDMINQPMMNYYVKKLST